MNNENVLHNTDYKQLFRSLRNVTQQGFHCSLDNRLTCITIKLIFFQQLGLPF
jgi:hypothetical protein